MYVIIYVHNEKVDRNILLIGSFHLFIIIYVHNKEVNRKVSLI